MYWIGYQTATHEAEIIAYLPLSACCHSCRRLSTAAVSLALTVSS
jgi:hypothetical protein